MRHERVDYIAKSIARRLSDYDTFEEIANHPSNYLESEAGLVNPYQILSLSHGLPAVCMLYGELNEHYPEEGWDQIAHQYMQRIGQQLQDEGCSSLSMFTGAAGIGLSTLCISKQKQRYSSFIDNINEWIVNSMGYMLEGIQSRDDLRMEDYDPISGITGIAAYTLLFHNESDSPELCEMNRKMIKSMIQMCQDKEIDGSHVPGWYISADNQFSNADKIRWPEGCFNIGLAHGIPSLLITLCNAYKKGICENGQLDCIRMLGDFLLKYRIETEEACYWGTHISMEEYRQQKSTSTYTRDAWCYGTPGVAYSLLIAGRLFPEEKYTSVAIASMKQAAVRREEIYCPTFCHGLSNIAYISYLFYEATGDKEFLQNSMLLSEEITTYYNEEAPFGFQTVDRKSGTEKYYNYAGLIDGVAGVVLTLLAIHKGTKTPWSAAFLLGD